MTGHAHAVGPHHQLVLGALPVVERAARKARWRCGDSASYDDLCSIGKIVLYDTIPRFRDGPGRSLGRFAQLRIWGEMMEELGRARAQTQMNPEMGLMADVERASPDAEKYLGDAQEKVRAVEALRRALRDLAEQDRLLLELLFTQGIDPATIGEALGVARETVYRRLQRLCARLRRRLREFGVTHAPSPTDLPAHQGSVEASTTWHFRLPRPGQRPLAAEAAVVSTRGAEGAHGGATQAHPRRRRRCQVG